MNLHQLHIFATVARLGSFSRAAEELRISQPSVSIQVADLERSLGVDLFEREGRGVRLTGAGRVLEDYARRILSLVEEAQAAVKETTDRDVAPFEVIDHTADVGIIVRGRTLPELFAHAAEGMMSFLIPPEAVQRQARRSVAAEAEDLPGLLIAWLNELLVLLNADTFVPAAFEVTDVGDRRVTAGVWGEPVDPSRHHFRLDVKAATYHQLYVRKDGFWEARVIFDV